MKPQLLCKRGRSEASEGEDDPLAFPSSEHCGPQRTASDTLPSAATSDSGPFARCSLPLEPAEPPACPVDPAHFSSSRHASRPSSPVVAGKEAKQLPAEAGASHLKRRSPPVDATDPLDEPDKIEQLHMFKRARRSSVGHLHGCSRSQLQAMARELEAAERQLREELREARCSYVRRAAELAREGAAVSRTWAPPAAVRGGSELPPVPVPSSCLRSNEPAVAEAVLTSTVERPAAIDVTPQQPAVSFSFPRLQPCSTTAAAAVTTAATPTACSSLAATGAASLARRASGDGSSAVVGTAAAVIGPLHPVTPRRGSSASGGAASAASAHPLPSPAACEQAAPPLSRDGVLSSVMEMLRSKAAAAAAAAAVTAPAPDAAVPPAAAANSSSHTWRLAVTAARMPTAATRQPPPRPQSLLQPPPQQQVRLEQASPPNAAVKLSGSMAQVGGAPFAVRQHQQQRQHKLQPQPLTAGQQASRRAPEPQLLVDAGFCTCGC